MTVGEGLSELTYASDSLEVMRGTYSGHVSMMPATSGDNFAGDVTFAIDGSTFMTNPSTLSVSQGEASVSAHVGCAATT
jgi:hypothetical protein